MMTETKRTFKTRWKAVEIDQTHFWREDIQKACGKIMTVYIYDENLYTHCCEITPSYLLIPVYNYAIYPQKVYDLPDDERNAYYDKWESELMEGLRDDAPSYYHVSGIETIDAKHKYDLPTEYNILPETDEEATENEDNAVAWVSVYRPFA